MEIIHRSREGFKTKKYNLLFTRHDGETDTAEIMIQKEHGWYVSYIKIGLISVQAIAGMETARPDSLQP
ncbi:MAG: hypothetical protein JRI94_00105 [Deltaproteobacteria bacterium]|nr:hypothetical protein [Deltaproteobacteria bacterium]MBW2031984.1 hypothetical protein [Deltaproteobacteria bacterium]